MTPNVPGLDVLGLNFVSLAAGYDMADERVDRPKRSGVLRESLAKPGPHLIEVEVDPSIPSLI